MLILLLLKIIQFTLPTRATELRELLSLPSALLPCSRLVQPSIGGVPTSLLPYILSSQLTAIIRQVEVTATVIETSGCPSQRNAALLLNGILADNAPLVVASAILWGNGTVNYKVLDPGSGWSPLTGENRLEPYNKSSLRWNSLNSHLHKANPVYFIEPICDPNNVRRLGKLYLVLRWKFDNEKDVRKESQLLIWMSSEYFPLNQCMNTSNNIRSKCQQYSNATSCIYQPGRGFQLGSYQCCCKERPSHCIDGSLLENEWTNALNFTKLCYPGDQILRKILLSITAVTTILSISLIFFVLTQRRVKESGSRGWALMEICLLGSIFMYAIVIIEYVNPPEAWSCAAVVWFRELGFVAFYGSIILKIYRNLVEYRVRKAHHVYVKEKDMMKYLACLLVLTMTGLMAWTLATSQGRDKKPFLDMGVASDHSSYSICRFQWWSIAWQCYELILLGYGLRLGYKTRSTDWGEKWQFGIAVLLETVLTLIATALKFNLMLVTGQDAMLLLTFAHIHATVSINLLLILVPKLFLQFYFSNDHRRSQSIAGLGNTGRAHPSLAKLRDNLVNGTIDFAQVPVNDMNPEDIRAELKRVYTQLRMFKMKSMYQDNPHIQNKRKAVKGKSSDKNPLKRRASDRTSVASPPSPRPTTATDARPEKVEMEMSSAVGSVCDDEHQPLTTSCTPPAERKPEPSLPPAAPPHRTESKDLTVMSSPHNVYLARGAVAATKKLSLEPDHSVRV